MTSGFTNTKTPLTASLYFRGREVSQDCQETSLKKANPERVSPARLWVRCRMSWFVSKMIYFKIWYLQIIVLSHLKNEIMFEYQDQCSLDGLSEEHYGYYCEVLACCTLPSLCMLCTSSLNLDHIWLWASLLSFLRYRIVGDRQSIEQEVSNTIPLLDPGGWRADSVNKMCDVFSGPHGTPRKAGSWGMWKIVNQQHLQQQVYFYRFAAYWCCGQRPCNYFTI